MLKNSVVQAIDMLRCSFPNNRVDVEADGQGGAAVTVHDVELGPQYSPSRSWIGFVVSFQYDATDVYPHFVHSDLARVDGRPLGQGFGKATWCGRPATQISRRSHGWSPGVDTAAGKLMKVLEWTRSQ